MNYSVFTARPGTLSSDSFVNLLDMRTAWQRFEADPCVFEGCDRSSGEPRWTTIGYELDPNTQAYPN
ncbi:MAG TPA: hypothetical protein VK325_11945 [Pseudoxanthomonas sp.]|nr:hypothetical protein [Pseudoxanthomonas sp.]